MYEEEARHILGQRGAEILVGIIEDAWASYRKEGQARRDRTRAMIVWDHMVALAEERLPALGVQRIEIYGSPYFIFGDRLALRLKKLDQGLLTRNVATNYQNDIARQGTLTGIHPGALVNAGYVLDAAQAGIQSIMAVRRVHGIREWDIDLRELAATGGMEPTTPILPGTGPKAPLPAIGTPRKSGEVENQS